MMSAMTITLSPYLGFRGNAREAVEYYHSVFGGELTISTFAEFHASEDPSEDNLVMHSQLTAESGMILMASDTPARMEYHTGTNISISLFGHAADEGTLTAYFEKLSDGGSVSQPLEKAVWGDWFGMCDDKFGITWLVNIAGDPAATPS
jgi:PhnB protein